MLATNGATRSGANSAGGQRAQRASKGPEQSTRSSLRSGNALRQLYHKAIRRAVLQLLVGSYRAQSSQATSTGCYRVPCSFCCLGTSTLLTISVNPQHARATAASKQGVSELPDGSCGEAWLEPIPEDLRKHRSAGSHEPCS